MVDLVARLDGWIHHPATIILLGVVLVFLGRALHFHLRCRFLETVEKQWHVYMRMEKPTYDDPQVRWLEERTQKMKVLVEEADAAPGDKTFMARAGYGYVKQSTLSALTNWLMKNQEVTPLIATALIRAQGHYRDQRNRNLNPLGWIEQLVFLPRDLIASLDPRIPKWVKDLVQICYWIAAAGAAVYTALHQ